MQPGWVKGTRDRIWGSFSEEDLSMSIESTCNMCQTVNLKFFHCEVPFTFRMCLHCGLLLSGRRSAQYISSKSFRANVSYSNRSIDGSMVPQFTVLSTTAKRLLMNIFVMLSQELPIKVERPLAVALSDARELSISVSTNQCTLSRRKAHTHANFLVGGVIALNWEDVVCIFTTAWNEIWNSWKTISDHFTLDSFGPIPNGILCPCGFLTEWCNVAWTVVCRLQKRVHQGCKQYPCEDPYES